MLAHMYLLMYLNIYFYFSRHDYVHFFFFAGHWLAMSNSCINPFIYAIFSVRNKMVRGDKLRIIGGILAATHLVLNPFDPGTSGPRLPVPLDK